MAYVSQEHMCIVMKFNTTFNGTSAENNESANFPFHQIGVMFNGP